MPTERIGSIKARELRKQGLRRCPRCKEIKELATQYYRSTKNHGFSSHCGDCMKLIASERHRAKPWEARERYEKTKRELRDAHLRRRFNISLADYEALHTKQNGLCAICGRPEVGKALAVDHDRKCCPSRQCCGKCVRALLCGRCNPAVGFLKDDHELAQKLVDYLRKHNGISARS